MQTPNQNESVKGQVHESPIGIHDTPVYHWYYAGTATVQNEDGTYTQLSVNAPIHTLTKYCTADDILCGTRAVVTVLVKAYGIDRDKIKDVFTVSISPIGYMSRNTFMGLPYGSVPESAASVVANNPDGLDADMVANMDKHYEG